MRSLAAIILLLFIALLILLMLSEDKHDNLPIIATPAAGEKLPAWRLYTACPVDRRNVPILQERKV